MPTHVVVGGDARHKNLGLLALSSAAEPDWVSQLRRMRRPQQISTIAPLVI